MNNNKNGYLNRVTQKTFCCVLITQKLEGGKIVKGCIFLLNSL